MRYGMNALNVIDGVKAKLKEIAPSLPPGVEIVTGYDRSWLINESIHTLKRDLIIEAIIVSFVSIVFLFHFRSALVPIITLPIAVLAAFIPMYYLQVSSNIMSLGGLALAIGVLIDAAIVMVENGYRHLAERNASARQLGETERRRILVGAAQQVGPALFYSLIIIVVSFLPVFLLEAQEGRMFRPLAWTKTLALIFSSLLSITLVPALMPIFLRGKLLPESKNPVSPHHARRIYLASSALVSASLENRRRAQSRFSRSHDSALLQAWQPVHAARYMKARPFTCRARCPESRSRRPSRLCSSRTASFARSLRCQLSSAP